MRKLQILVFGVCLAASTNLALAEDKKAEKKKGPALTEEQKKVRQELLDKYDTNKDGKLSRDERNKMSDADREKAQKAHLLGQGRKKAKPAQKAQSDHSSDHSSPPVKTQ
jgi:hypothetical protein